MVWVWKLALLVALVVFVGLVVYGATTGTEAPSATMLWVATAVGGLAAIPVIQVVKTIIDKVLGKLLGAAISGKLMVWVAWGVCYGVAVAVYAAFGGLSTIFATGFGIFTSGSTVGMIATAVYKGVGDKLSWSRDEATT
jgi:hypothetical protein